MDGLLLTERAWSNYSRRVYLQASWSVPEHRVSTDWPGEGVVEFKTYSTRYRPDLKLVLKDVTCRIKSGEKVQRASAAWWSDNLFLWISTTYSKINIINFLLISSPPCLSAILPGCKRRECITFQVGIIGRTGAGKSSMTLALFRIIEAVSGCIEIDGLDIGQLGLHDLRNKLTVIPQVSTAINIKLNLSHTFLLF